VSLFNLATDADRRLVAGLDVEPLQLVDHFTNDVITGEPVETQDNEMQRDAAQLIGVDAVERKRLVEHRVQRFAKYARFHLVLTTRQHITMITAVNGSR